MVLMDLQRKLKLILCDSRAEIEAHMFLTKRPVFALSTVLQHNTILLSTIAVTNRESRTDVLPGCGDGIIRVDISIFSPQPHASVSDTHTQTCIPLNSKGYMSKTRQEKQNIHKLVLSP